MCQHPWSFTDRNLKSSGNRQMRRLLSPSQTRQNFAAKAGTRITRWANLFHTIYHSCCDASLGILLCVCVSITKFCLFAPFPRASRSLLDEAVLRAVPYDQCLSDQ